jgi:hypothetical protein
MIFPSAIDIKFIFVFTFGKFQNNDKIIVTKFNIELLLTVVHAIVNINLLTMAMGSFQLVNEPVRNTSLSSGKAGYLNTTGIVFFSCCESIGIDDFIVDDG